MIRLGSIQFINSLVVDLGFLSGNVPIKAGVTQAAPAVLNDKILNGELDMGPVSALWYAEHEQNFLLLPDLSISSESGVRSVLLLSRYPFKDLAKRRVAVTTTGRTTPALFQILCRRRYGFTPETVLFDRPFDGNLGDADAALVIGDEALLAKERFGNNFHVIDLAEEWSQWTGEPLVFAVWVARRDFFERNPMAAFQTYQQILNSKRWGLSRPDEVINEAERRTQLHRTVLENYFSGLSYGFNARLRKGMKLYLDYAFREGLLPKRPGDLEMIGAYADAMTPAGERG
jgi:chorismate dehydratase